MANAAFRVRALLGPAKAAARAASAQESSRARSGPPDAVDAAVIAQQLRAAAAESGPASALADDDEHLDRLAASLVEQAGTAFAALDAGASESSLTDGQRIALESVMRTRGRPALVIDDDLLEPLDDERHPGSGFWRIPVGDHEAKLLRVASSSGAVMVRNRANGAAPIVVGTAWLIGADPVVTNRHVLLPQTGPALVDRRSQDRSVADI